MPRNGRERAVGRCAEVWPPEVRSTKREEGDATEPAASGAPARRMSQDEGRHRADGWSLRQFRARGWTGAVLVALFGGIAALVPYYSALVLLLTVVATIATLLAWLLISLRARRYTPPLSVHLSSMVFIFVAVALLSVAVGANRPGTGVGARLLGLAGATFAAAAIMGWLRPSRRVHDGPLFAAILAAGLCLAASMKLSPRTLSPVTSWRSWAWSSSRPSGTHG